jgi:hypothetical protein
MLCALLGKRPAPPARSGAGLDKVLSETTPTSPGKTVPSYLKNRKKLCHLWFHTAYVRDNFLVLTKEFVDKANKVSHCLPQGAPVEI